MHAIKNQDLPHHTYDDYVAWEGRWELIYGVPYAMSPAPARYHQKVNSRIIMELGKLLENCKDCEATIFLDFKIGEDIVLQPDALVLCNNFEETNYITKAPEIVFEILSPRTKRKDLNLKYEIYENAGVKYYVIVDPVKKQCFVYQLVDGKYIMGLTTETGNFLFETDGCPIDFDFGKIW